MHIPERQHHIARIRWIDVRMLHVLCPCLSLGRLFVSIDLSAAYTSYTNLPEEYRSIRDMVR